MLARKDISAGTLINSDDIKGAKILPAYVTPQPVNKENEIPI